MGIKEFYYIINALAGINAVSFFCLLMFKKKQSITNKAIAIMLLILGLYFCNSILMLLHGPTTVLNYSFFLVQFFAIFFPPMAYVYVFSLLGKKINKKNPIFILSGLIGFIPITLFIQNLGLSPKEQQAFFYSLIAGPYPDKVTFYSVVFYGFQQIVFGYLMYQCYLVRLKKKKVLADLSGTKINYVWNFLFILVIGNISIVSMYLLFDILFVEYLLLPIIVSIIYSFIVYHAFKNSVLFSKEELRQYVKEQQQNKPPKIKNQIPAEECQKIAEKIEVLFKVEKTYRIADLSLDKLSKIIEEPNYKVSYTLNNYLEISFYDFVNKQRIAEAKELLKNNKKYTIEGVGLEVGYNSRSTFYRAFKKYTGETPANYDFGK